MFVLYKVFPPTVFLMSILFNQIAIRFFNHLMSHTEYVPIVNTKGDVIRKTPAIEAVNYKKRIHQSGDKNSHIHSRNVIPLRQAINSHS